MPDDPNKKMDELLKAYAQERRKAPELYLHPATRRMLNSEVSRAFAGGKGKTPWFHRLRAFWPQIVFGSSLCLILGVAVLSLRQPPRVPEKALPERPPSPSEAPSFATEPQPTSDSLAVVPELKRAEESELREAEDLSKLKKEQVPSERLNRSRAVTLQRTLPPSPVIQEQDSGPLATTPPEPGASATSGAQPQTAGKDAVKQIEYSFQNRVAAPAQAAPSPARSDSPAAEARVPLRDASVAGVPAAPSIASLELSAADKLALASELTNLGAARRLQFVQAGGTLQPQPAPTALFSSFQMEQLGTNIRFFDQDGSVYLGAIDLPTNTVEEAVLGTRLTTASATPPSRRGVAQERLVEQRAAPTNEPAFTFRASGTNRTLGRTVVVTGGYFERTNTPPTAATRYSIAPRAASAGRSEQRQEALRMIIGTAVVGETNQIPLRAVSRE